MLLNYHEKLVFSSFSSYFAHTFTNTFKFEKKKNDNHDGVDKVYILSH